MTCFTMLLDLFLFSVIITVICNGKYPWVGVLEVTVDSGAKAVTGLIMIEENTAIAVANDVSKLSNNLLINSAKSYFYYHDKTSECCLVDYKLHPEYNKVMNTIALLYLKCNTNYWSLIYLPNVYTDYKHNLFTIISKDDSSMGFIQIKYRVHEVNQTSCVDFYESEEINYKSLWPKHVVCVKADVDQSCVFDPGMALVSKKNNKLILVGISILGPGCSLPSRYIQLSSYIPWIKRNLYTHKKYRRLNVMDGNIPVNYTTPNPKLSYIVSEGLENQDDFVVDKLNDTTMVLRKNLSDVREEVFGKCKDIDGEPMYREVGRIEAPGYTATGIYALSLFDTLFENITCVMVTVHCDKRSITKFWTDRGFRQNDLEHLIKTVPIVPRNQTVPPKTLFIKDRYSNYEPYTTQNILFKFEFTEEAKITVEFFGQQFIRVEKKDEADTLLRSARECL